MFVERTVPDYCEPVVASELELGTTYFSVTYVDGEMRVPVVETLVYLGSFVDDSKESLYRFQDAESYARKDREPPAGPTHGMYVECSADYLKSVFFLDKTIDELIRCAVRRKSGSAPPAK